MRDAFGGAFMIKLLIVFIVIYVGFTAIALNYAKAFKVKNRIISYIEEKELKDISKMPAIDKMNFQEFIEKELLGNMNYSGKVACSKKASEVYCKDGIRVVKHSSSKSETNKNGVYYTVTTSFGWQIPFLNVLLSLSDSDNGETVAGYWTISGETRNIV